MKIIAHRGNSCLYPENTLPAFSSAVEAGADGIEMDLYLTADNKVAVIHDPNTGRIGDIDIPVELSEMSKLKKIDAGKWKGKEWEGVSIPELNEVMEIVPQDIELVLELKSDKKILKVLRDYIANSRLKVENFVIISFNDSVLSVKEYIPEVKAYLLNGDEKTIVHALQKAAKFNLDGVDLLYSLVNEDIMEKAKKLGLDVYVWTVDDITSIWRLQKLGVSAITTNIPSKIKEAFNEKNREL